MEPGNSHRVQLQGPGKRVPSPRLGLLRCCPYGKAKVPDVNIDTEMGCQNPNTCAYAER